MDRDKRSELWLILDEAMCHYYGYHTSWSPAEYAEFITDLEEEVTDYFKENKNE